MQRLRGVLELAAAEETSSGDHDDLQDMPERPASTAPLPAKRQSHSLSPRCALNPFTIVNSNCFVYMI